MEETTFVALYIASIVTYRRDNICGTVACTLFYVHIFTFAWDSVSTHNSDFCTYAAMNSDSDIMEAKQDGIVYIRSVGMESVKIDLAN